MLNCHMLHAWQHVLCQATNIIRAHAPPQTRSQNLVSCFRAVAQVSLPTKDECPSAVGQEHLCQSKGKVQRGTGHRDGRQLEQKALTPGKLKGPAGTSFQ